MRHIYFYLLLTLCGSFSTLHYCYADNKSDLQSVRQSIADQEKKLAEQKKQRIKFVEDLKKQETAIARLLASLDKSDKLLATLLQDIGELNPQINDLEKKQVTQRQILAKQLEGAFKLGKTSSMELVFAGQESERNERIITYYRYINEERQNRINNLKKIQDEINSKKILLEQKHQSQLALQQKQKEQRDNLLVNQQQRKNTISALEQSMQLNQQKLDELKENEVALQQQIAKAERESKKIAEDEAKQAAQIKAKQQNYNYNPTKDEKALMARTSGIGKPNHILSWPVTGSILYQFGEPQQGELRWKGLVINAKEGTKVKAIADGRVILANWLQGYGFIVAIEHGKGDMTLYGYNQRVLVDVGDKIEAGQDIALVGTTGGQGNSSLYFEVRRDGKALDPSAWLKK
ncbi:murein hydrolase activator EnvC [Orbus wheelerorum]|uniref:murein hydrolase activator EnvC n=1 Tax=Orbus wheelerorum TaxID=3074111 RepID=UPI00370D073C